MSEDEKGNPRETSKGPKKGGNCRRANFSRLQKAPCFHCFETRLPSSSSPFTNDSEAAAGPRCRDARLARAAGGRGRAGRGEGGASRLVGAGGASERPPPPGGLCVSDVNSLASACDAMASRSPKAVTSPVSRAVAFSKPPGSQAARAHFVRDGARGSGLWEQPGQREGNPRAEGPPHVRGDRDCGQRPTWPRPQPDVAGGSVWRPSQHR